MKKPSDLTRRELEKIVAVIQSLLYMDVDEPGPDGEPRVFWNPDRLWDDAADLLDGIARCLHNQGLVPETLEQV